MTYTYILHTQGRLLLSHRTDFRIHIQGGSCLGAEQLNLSRKLIRNSVGELQLWREVGGSVLKWKTVVTET